MRHIMSGPHPLLFLTLLLILLSLSTITPCHAQTNLLVSPNTTTNLTTYTDQPPLTTTWTLSTPDIGITVHNISMVPPLYPFLSLRFSLSIPVQVVQSLPIAITVAVNSSLMQPAAYNLSVNVTYGPLYQTLVLNYTLVCLQGVQFVTNFSAPYRLSVGQPFVTAIKLRSRPYSSLNLSVGINQQSGDYSGTTSSGVAWRGGGPLLASNVSWLYFDATNWNVTRVFTIGSVYTPLIYGDRWSLLNYSWVTNDSTLLPSLNATFSNSPINVTIVETNIASVQYTHNTYTLYKNAQPSFPLTLSLTAQPRALVYLTFTPTPWTTIIPASLTFTPLNWNTTVTVTALLAADYTIGWEDVVMRFPMLVSEDEDYAAVSGGVVELVLLDGDASFESFYPYFGPPGTNLTLTWPSNLTFTPHTPDYPVATVECVFGAGQYACNASATGWCPTAVPAVVVGERQVVCTAPACQYDAAEGRACYSPAGLSVSINGLPASLSANTTANLTSSCDIGSCKVAPTVVFTGHSPIPAQCLAAGCSMWPAAFSYLPAPVITSISPLTSELSTSNPITVILTVLGAAPFSSPTALCIIGGVPSPAYATFATNTSTVGSQQSATLTCLTPLRYDLLGSTASTPLPFRVTLTGQAVDLSAAGVFVLAGVDGVSVKQGSDVTAFLVCCLLAVGSVCALVFQHYCCRDCRTINHQLTGEGKSRGERGPQMLIDLLEPRVRLKARLVEEEERRRREEEREERQKIEERLRKLKADKRAEEEKERVEKERVKAAIAEKGHKRLESLAVVGAQARSPAGALTRARLMLGVMKATTSDSSHGAEGSGSPLPPLAGRHARSGSVVASVLGRMRGNSNNQQQQQPQIVISRDESSAPLLESKEEAKENGKRQHRHLAVDSAAEHKERKSKKGHHNHSRNASPAASPSQSERTLKPKHRDRGPSHSGSRSPSPSPGPKGRSLQR